MIEFVIPAVPVAQPRQRHRVMRIGGKTIVQNYTPTRHPVNDFKAACKLACAAEFHGEPLAGPLRLDVVFVMPRPKVMAWKNKPTPRLWNQKKPDVDNLLKSLADALNGLLWCDDSQLSLLVVRKVIAAGSEQPHVLVRVDTLSEPHPAAK